MMDKTSNPLPGRVDCSMCGRMLHSYKVTARCGVQDKGEPAICWECLLAERTAERDEARAVAGVLADVLSRGDRWPDLIPIKALALTIREVRTGKQTPGINWGAIVENLDRLAPPPEPEPVPNCQDCGRPTPTPLLTATDGVPVKHGGRMLVWCEDCCRARATKEPDGVCRIADSEILGPPDGPKSSVEVVKVED